MGLQFINGDSQQVQSRFKDYETHAALCVRSGRRAASPPSEKICLARRQFRRAFLLHGARRSRNLGAP
jgi:hypothetical protein